MWARTLAAAPASVIHVPRDVKDLQTALLRVPGGGIVELAGGVYASPASGFRIANPGRSFTVQAASGATVVIDGGGARPLFDIANGNRDRGGEVVFQRLVFRNALTNKSGRGGFRIEKAEVRFVACRFENNRAVFPAEGAAMRIATGSKVTLAGCSLVGNRAEVRGGAVSVIGSQLFVARSRFAGNRVDLAANGPNAAGGALYLLDSFVAIYDSLFEGNAAGYVGGAIYAFGTYGAQSGVPATEILLGRSTLRQNQAEACAGCATPGPSEGGALHVENATTAWLQRVIVDGNQAEDGGGLSSFRGRLELDDSVLRGNRAASAAGALRNGGAVVLFSADPADPNGSSHAAASLAARRSLFEGRFGVVGSGAASGGCVAAAGVQNRADGRATVAFDRSVFFACGAEPSASTAAGGGALYLVASRLRLDDSMVLAGSATGDGGQGGAIVALPGAVIGMARSTLAGNRAAYAGGAIAAAGAEFAVSDSWFLANVVAQGAFSALTASRGAAIFSRPAPGGSAPSPVTGAVSNSTFLEQEGLPLFDIDQDGPPVNDLHYDGNVIANGSFGARVYALAPARREGLSVEQLNELVVFRGGAPATDKARSPNTRAAFASRAGALLAVASAGAPGADVGPQLAFAWAGGSATLDGVHVQDRTGLLPRAGSGASVLTIDGTDLAVAPGETERCTSGPVLCFAGGRFRVTLRWQTTDGTTGAGTASNAGPALGKFSLGAPATGQVTAQLLDSCARNGHFWIYLDGSASAALRATVFDTWSGQSRDYTRPAGAAAWLVRDRASFTACGLPRPPSPPAAAPLGDF